MTLDASKVGVAITGLVSRAPLATAAPTTQSTPLAAAFIDVGFISVDGITQTIPGSGDATNISVWQNGATVRTIRSAAQDLPSIQFTMMETKVVPLETYYNATVSVTATEGSLVYNSLAIRSHFSWVFDYVDGADLERIYVPDGLVTEVGDRVWVTDDAVKYEVTIEAQLNTLLAGNFKLWTTRAKT